MFQMTEPARRLLLACGCLAATTAFAEDERGLAQVVVTATRTEQSIREVPAAVSVIDRERIEASGATTVDQVLQGVPGVYAARMDASSPNRIAQTYSRGLPGNSRTLVLLDGIPMNVLYDGQVDWSQLSTQDVERVEVVRGASSGLYGANAMGGVINVLSRAPEPGTKTRLGVEYGSLDSKRLLASHSQRFGATSIRVSASHFASDGYDMWRQDTTIPAANRDKIGTVKDNAGVKLLHEIDAQSFVEAGVSYLKDEATGFYHPGAPGYQPSKREQYVPTVRYVRDDDSSNTSVALYGRFGKQWADTLNPATYATISEKGLYEDRSVGFNAQHSRALGSIHRVTLGLDFLDGDVDNHFSYPGSSRLRDTRGDLRRYGVFIQDEMALTARWKLNLAGRYDHWTTGGNQVDSGVGQPSTSYRERSAGDFSPKLATLFKVNDAFNLRASAGRAFNLPDMFNLYANTRRGTTTYWANPDLQPETVKAYDLGADYYFGRRGYVKATLYYNDAKDFIYSVRRDATNVDKINVGAVTTRGLELEAAYRPSEALALSASFTFNRSRIEENASNPDLEGKSLTSVPRRHGQLRADYRWPGGATLSAAVNRVGKRYADDINSKFYKAYTTLDLTASYPLGKTFSARLNVINVGDKVYDGIGYLAPGRTVTAGLYANF